MPVTCIVCHHNKIEQVMHKNHVYYFCETCNELYERAIDSMYGKDVVINSPQGIHHVNSGGLIRREEQFLLLKRRAYPFGYAFPAGHLEYNEEPIDGLKREVFEETGLKVEKANLLFKGTIEGSKCRYGADNHYWYFYDCTCRNDTPFLNPESESIGWYTKEEASELPLIPSAQFLMNYV